MCAFQTVKSVDDGTVRHFSQNDLVGTVSDFSLFQSYTNVPPLLKKYKECSCALPTINIPEDIWFELTLKDHQNEEVIWMENFLSAETTAKTHGACVMPEKNMCQTLHPRIVPFFHY